MPPTACHFDAPQGLEGSGRQQVLTPDIFVIHDREQLTKDPKERRCLSLGRSTRRPPRPSNEGGPGAGGVGARNPTPSMGHRSPQRLRASPPAGLQSDPAGVELYKRRGRNFSHTAISVSTTTQSGRAVRPPVAPQPAAQKREVSSPKSPPRAVHVPMPPPASKPPVSVINDAEYQLEEFAHLNSFVSPRPGAFGLDEDDQPDDALLQEVQESEQAFAEAFLADFIATGQQ
eukprot:EG_transcript_18601